MAEYNFKKIEAKWQKAWEQEKTFKVDVKKTKKKYYNLEMFPYPSGEGLHMGHALNYTIGDIRARFMRMKGFGVLYPMGYDSFGLPAENAAIKAGVHPKKYTSNSIKNFIMQQKRLGLSYDWSKMLSSCEPEYYRWNQYFFLKFLERGLVYRKKASVNWCPKCDTVLANEQVHNGKCWRHTDTEVQIKPLEQWFFKITDYADELLDMVDDLDWPNRIKTMQKNWIGKSHGSEILFEIPTKFSKAILIHGKSATPKDKWYPWLVKTLKENKIDCFAPELPNPSDPDLTEWINEINKTSPDEDSILIGHSRGGVAILRWLEKLPKGRRVKKVILVSTNSGNSKSMNKSERSNGFYTLEGYNFEKIKSHCDDFIVVHSKDDPIVSFSAGEENSKGLNARLKSYENKKHFGIKEAPEIPEVLEEILEKWPIFTTRPDTIFGVTFMVVSAQHPRLMELVTKEQKKDVECFLKKLRSVSEKELEAMEKEGVFTGSYAINPANNEKVPVYAGNFVLADYGSGMVMAVPAHDQRDFEFAKKYGIKIKQVIEGELTPERAYTGQGKLINSEKFDGLDNEKAKEEIVKFLEKKKLAKKTIQYKLRDWLISRQRYWGTPIPIIYCDKCGIVPVPAKDLPVILPEDIMFGKGNPLATSKKFVDVKCPKCGAKARRETDTMDTFVDSSWYFMRFPDNKNTKEPFDKKIGDSWLPVDTYIGGAEHACMHLLYARFWTKALRDMDLVKYDEPFKKLFNQGMLHASDGRKMSKSLGNVINPIDIVEKFGADALRLTLMSFASPDSDTNWDEKVLVGSYRFLERVFSTFEDIKIGKSSSRTESKLNKAIKQITEDIENFKYNLAIIKLRELFGLFGEEESRDALKKSLILLSPFCPHLAEELWQKIGGKGFVSLAEWPVADESKIDERLDKQEQAIEKLAEDINHVLKLVGKKSAKAFVYVLHNEKDFYLEGISVLEKKTGLEVKIFAVNDKEKHDPEGKAKKAKPGKPGIYLE